MAVQLTPLLSVILSLFFFLPSSLENLMLELLLVQIPIQEFYGLWISIVKIIAILSIAAFAGIGIWVMLDNGPYRRAKSKDALKNMILLAFAVSASFYLYVLLLDLGSAIAVNVLSWAPLQFDFGGFDFSSWISDFNLEKITADVSLAIFMQAFYVLALILASMTLAFRVIFVVAGAGFFPIAVALYFLPAARPHAILIMKLLLLMIFLPIPDIVIMQVGSTVGGFLPLGGDFLKASSLLLVALINTAVIFIALLPAARSVERVVFLPARHAKVSRG